MNFNEEQLKFLRKWMLISFVVGVFSLLIAQAAYRLGLGLYNEIVVVPQNKIRLLQLEVNELRVKYEGWKPLDETLYGNRFVVPPRKKVKQ